MDNESWIGCPSRSDASGTDADKGAKVCTMVQREIGELH